MLLDELVRLAKHARVLVTSRRLASLEHVLQKTPQVAISANNSDIVQYVNSRIRDNGLLRRHIQHDKNLEFNILLVVTFKAMGMFLMAKLHMDALTSCTKKRDIRTALQLLPTELDKTYDDAITRIRTQHRHQCGLAFKVLGILAYVKRPLAVQELRIMVAAELEMLELGKMSPEDLDDEISLVSICVGLVQVVGSDSRHRRRMTSTSRSVQLARECCWPCQG